MSSEALILYNLHLYISEAAPVLDLCTLVASGICMLRRLLATDINAHSDRAILLYNRI